MPLHFLRAVSEVREPLTAKLVIFRNDISGMYTIWPIWKFHNISITQILCEISFADSESAKSAIFTHLETQKFDFYEFLHFLKAEI